MEWRFGFFVDYDHVVALVVAVKVGVSFCWQHPVSLGLVFRFEAKMLDCFQIYWKRVEILEIRAATIFCFSLPLHVFFCVN